MVVVLGRDFSRGRDFVGIKSFSMEKFYREGVLWVGCFMGRVFYGEGVLWVGCFMGRVFYGEGVLWGGCFMGRVFYGEGVLWRGCFMGKKNFFVYGEESFMSNGWVFFDGLEKKLHGRECFMGVYFLGVERFYGGGGFMGVYFLGVERFYGEGEILWRRGAETI